MGLNIFPSDITGFHKTYYSKFICLKTAQKHMLMSYFEAETDTKKPKVRIEYFSVLRRRFRILFLFLFFVLNGL